VTLSFRCNCVADVSLIPTVSSLKAQWLTPRLLPVLRLRNHRSLPSFILSDQNRVQPDMCRSTSSTKALGGNYSLVFFFIFCWPCISVQFLSITNLTHSFNVFIYFTGMPVRNRHTRRPPTQSDIYQMRYWYNLFLNFYVFHPEVLLNQYRD